jgi:SPP1 family phage portal protein
MNKFNLPVFKTNQKELDKKSIESILQEHKSFKSRYKHTYDYYIGNHKILYKTMTDPTKPNNKVICSLPSYSVDIRTGYFSGEPITFTSDNEKQQEAVLSVLEYNDFQDINSELDKLTAIYGHAFLILWIDEDGQIRMATESPDNVILVYDNTLALNPIGAIRYFEYKDALTNNDILEMTVFKKDSIEYYTGSQKNLTLTKKEPNYFGDIPVIEFMENAERKCCYLDSINTVDAIEEILSSCMNEIEYFGSCYMTFKGLTGTEPEDIQDMKNNRSIILEEGGEVQFITRDVNDTFIQNTLNSLTERYHMLTKTPALSDESFSGNASGVALKFKLFGLEKDLSKKESKWRKSIQKMLELITNRLNMIGGSYRYQDVKITFSRALPTNSLENAQLVSSLNGIVPTETLIAQLDFIEKPKEEMKKLQEEKMQFFNSTQMYDFDKVGDSNDSK